MPFIGSMWALSKEGFGYELRKEMKEMKEMELPNCGKGAGKMALWPFSSEERKEVSLMLLGRLKEAKDIAGLPSCNV